jgi:hypothetical protein
MVGFTEFAERKNLTVDKYPYAKAGLRTMGIVFRLFFATLLFWVLNKGFGFLFGWLSDELDGGEGIVLDTSKTVLKGIKLFDFSFILPMATNVVEFLYRITLMFATIACIATILSVCGYLLLLVLRWRSYERNCVTNDFKARKLKRDMLNTLAVNQSIANIRRAYAPNKNGETKEISFDDQSKLNALNALKHMSVTINTRQSLESEDLEQRFHISISVPFIQKETNELQNLLKDFDKVATRMEKGGVSFGSQIISSDQQTIEFFDSIIVPDKYAFEVITDDSNVEYGESEYIFPLDLFVDRTDKIKAAEKSAKRWAYSMAEDMDALLTTLDVPSKRSELHCGSRNVMMRYEISFRPQQNVVNSLPEQINRRFDTEGSTANLAGNRIDIVIDLPKECQSPIDTKTLFRQAFG